MTGVIQKQKDYVKLYTIGDKIADSVLKGCNVHWTRSYQRIAEKVNSHVKINNRLLAKEAFCTIAKHVILVKNKDVLKLFDVLQGEAPVSSVKYIKLPLSDEHFAVVDQDCDWTAAKSWVQWWIRPKHLQMLAKPFSIMQAKDWDKASRNTNGVERANCLAKSSQNRPGLYAAMQSLYEKDKMFALQYVAAAENGSKISYRTPQEEECR